MSHSIAPIPALEKYFGAGSTPVIAQVYSRERGWVLYPFRKRVSRSWLTKLRAEGITFVGLEFPGQPTRTADFSVEELLK